MENNNQEKNYQISTEYFGNQKLQKLSISGDDKFVSEKFKEITENNKREEYTQNDNWKYFSLIVFILLGIFTSFIIKCDPNFYETLFWIAAFLWSGFLGVYAFQIHFSNTDYEYQPWAVRIHQFIFNFGLALLGWIILYNFLPLKTILNDLNTTKLTLLGVVIISLSGYLPKLVSLTNPFNKS